MCPNLPKYLPKQQVATATYALQLIAKSLNQVDSYLDEIRDQIPGLLRDEARQLADGLAMKSDHLSRLHSSLADLVKQLVGHDGGQEGELSPEEPPEPEDPMGEKDPWETDYPQLTSYQILQTISEVKSNLDRFRALAIRFTEAARQEADPRIREWLIRECDALLQQAYQAEDRLAQLLKDLVGHTDHAA